MNQLEFYKSLFDREQIRRVELENSVNIPIGITTLIVGTISFVFKEMKISLCNPLIIFFGLIILLILLSMFFLAKSYNNLFKGFGYKNLPNTKELFNYQQDLESYNKEVEEQEREKFEDYLLKNYVDMTDNNGKINQKRLLSLYRAKTTLIITFVLTTCLIATYFINNLNN